MPRFCLVERATGNRRFIRNVQHDPAGVLVAVPQAVVNPRLTLSGSCSPPAMMIRAASSARALTLPTYVQHAPKSRGCHPQKMMRNDGAVTRSEAERR